MADERTEKQKVQEITDKLEKGLKELFESEKYKTYLSTMEWSMKEWQLTLKKPKKFQGNCEKRGVYIYEGTRTLRISDWK